jgi:YjbE family integral membrane protein
MQRVRQVVNSKCTTSGLSGSPALPSKTFDLNRAGLIEAIACSVHGHLQPFQPIRAEGVETNTEDFMEQFLSSGFWVAVGQIIMIDILLGGDNAVVIALACRKLPPARRAKGILWGTAGAILLRVVLIFFALTLLSIPFLKLIGALLLAWIGVKLIAPADDDAHGDIAASDKLWAAVKTVIVADLVMSVDNVIAIAGAAQGAGAEHQMALVIFGLLASIPIIIWGSQLVIKLMERFPFVIKLGGMLLGWIAGTMGLSDPVIANPDAWTWAPKLPQSDAISYVCGIAGALLVLAIGQWMASRRTR